MVNKHPPPVADEVFFDGSCPVCRREIGLYRKMRSLRDVAWTDISDPAVAPDGIDRDIALARFHVRLDTGEIVSGAWAFIAIWRLSPRTRWLARILSKRPFLDLTELAYDGFLHLRKFWR